MQSQTCHKEHEYTVRLQRTLGADLAGTRCHVVDTGEMSTVMRKSGWSKNETNGVIGFQVGDDVYVLNSTPWTVLHEMIHKAGVNADRMNRYVAEGLTEAIAKQMKKAPDEHRPTYPQETAWVERVLLPKVGMNAVQLGREIVKAKDPPARLARLIAARDSSVNEGKLRRQLKSQLPDKPSFNKRGSATRLSIPTPAGQAGEDRAMMKVAGVLLLAAFGLALPVIAGKRREGDRNDA